MLHCISITRNCGWAFACVSIAITPWPVSFSVQILSTLLDSCYQITPRLSDCVFALGTFK